jgi:hypothetical protein
LSKPTLIDLQLASTGRARAFGSGRLSKPDLGRDQFASSLKAWWLGTRHRAAGSPVCPLTLIDVSASRWLEIVEWPSFRHRAAAGPSRLAGRAGESEIRVRPHIGLALDDLALVHVSDDVEERDSPIGNAFVHVLSSFEWQSSCTRSGVAS